MSVLQLLFLHLHGECDKRSKEPESIESRTNTRELERPEIKLRRIICKQPPLNVAISCIRRKKRKKPLTLQIF